MKKLFVTLLVLMAAFLLLTACESIDQAPNDSTGSIEADTPEAEEKIEGTTEENTPPHQHIEEKIPAIPATCLKTGLTEGKKCSECGEILVAQETVAQLEHSYDNHFCTQCGDPKMTEGLILKLNDEGTAYQVAGLGDVKDTDIYIASTYQGLPVISIGSSAFTQCKNLQKVFLGDGIQLIDWSAFFGCTGLTEIKLPAGLRDIGMDAFGECTALIQEEGGVLYVGKWVIGCDTTLAEVVLRDDTVGIGTRGLMNCSGMTSIELPTTVRSIGNNAFYKCTGLTRIDIPASVTYIAAEAFRRCDSLTGVYITDLAAWCSIYFDGLFANPLEDVHSLYLNGTLVTDLILPEGVTAIGNRAFSGCTGLTSITIPEGVLSIGEYAFSSCSNVTSLNLSASVTSIHNGAFSECSSLADVRFAENSRLESIGGSAFFYCRSLKSIEIPASVTSIEQLAFASNYLDKIYITDMAAWCNIQFSYGLYTEPFPSGYTLYLNGQAVTDLVIPDGVTSIGDYAFYQCGGLNSVSIPASVTRIGASAFYDNTHLKRVNITDIAAWCEIEFGDEYSNPMRYTYNLYLNGTQITDLVIPDGVTSIGDYAFYQCGGLNSVSIPASVTRIGVSAFYNNTHLKRVNITDMAAWCEIEFGDEYSNPMHYAHDWYLNGTQITDVVIPEGVTTIRTLAFQRCDDMTSITIPASVTSIEPMAFIDCSSLTEVIFTTTTGWYRVYEGNETSGPAMDVSDPVQNAINLKEAYFYDYWKRS